MATSGPTRPRCQKAGMILTADDQIGPHLLLKVAFQAKVRITRLQHFVIDGTMRLMAARAAVPQRLMLKGKRPALSSVAAQTGVVCGCQCGTSTHHCISRVWVVAITTAHFPLENRMAVGKAEFTSLVEVAVETRL